MSDVALVAGVGISTVSNVLNHPHKVAATTLERVQQAIADLDFQRSEEAMQLRRGKRPNKSKSGSAKVPTSATSAPAPDSVDASPDKQVAIPKAFLCLLPGTRVNIMTDGLVIGSGVVDVCMADGSAIWLWMDDGGRRLIHCYDDLKLRRPDRPA